VSVCAANEEGGSQEGLAQALFINGHLILAGDKVEQ
jgi:hypothetical protein